MEFFKIQKGLNEKERNFRLKGNLGASSSSFPDLAALVLNS